MGERICVLKDGRIQQVDTPTALYERPANAFVASFIGSPEMNIVDASLQATPGGLAVRVGGALLPLPAEKAQRLHGGSAALRFGLRPEHIGLLPRTQGDGTAVPARLRFTEHMGSEVYVHVDLGDLPMSARVPAEQAVSLQGLQRGDALSLHLQMAACHLFDAGDGRNLLL